MDEYEDRDSDSERKDDSPRNQNKRWTPEDDFELLRMWDDGASFDELGEKTGRSSLALKARIGLLLTERRDQEEEVEEGKTTSATGSRIPPKDPSFDPKFDFPFGSVPPGNCLICKSRLGERCYACGIPL